MNLVYCLHCYRAFVLPVRDASKHEWTAKLPDACPECGGPFGVFAEMDDMEDTEPK